MAYKRVLINLAEELLEEVDRAAKSEHRTRSEFVREALRDRIVRSDFASSLAHLRARAENQYPEAEVDQDITDALEEVRPARKAGQAG